MNIYWVVAPTKNGDVSQPHWGVIFYFEIKKLFQFLIHVDRIIGEGYSFLSPLPPFYAYVASVIVCVGV